MKTIKKLIKDLEENEGITLGDDILPYVEKAITQALAEERARVVSLAKREYLRGRIDCVYDMKKTTDNLTELEKRYKQYLKDNPALLASLDKPLTK